MKKLAIAVLVLTGGMAHAASLAGNAAAGQGKAEVCAACHGLDGNSMVPNFPKLAGQHPSYIAKQLAAFKAGARQDPTMAPMAAPLGDQDMADLAAYFGAQTRVVGTVMDREKAIAGGKIYRGGNSARGLAACSSCHGPNGAGNAVSSFPALNGQQTAYVVKALQDFRSGVRTTDPGMMMRDVAGKMSDAEIEAVAEFIAALK